MTKVISLINLKGGVAKTTTTVQLAECLASEFNKKVLVIDLDPQTNATIALIGEEKWEDLDQQGQTIFHLFNDKIEHKNVFQLDKAIQTNASNLNIKNLNLLSSSIRLIDIQDRISEVAPKSNYAIAPVEVIKSCLKHEIQNYDYVLIDCPPNLGFITRNGIEISDYFLIPTIPDTLSTYGIPQIVKTIHQFAQDRALKIQCLGLVITKYVSTSTAHTRGIRTLEPRFKEIFQTLKVSSSPVFNTIIPQANATAEAMSFDNPNSVTFKMKYGRSQSGNKYLYEYVLDLTKELMEYAGA